MGDLEVLLKSVPLYINLDEVQRQQAGPDPEAAVAASVGDVIRQLAGELLAGVAGELASPGIQGCVKDPARGEELRVEGNRAFGAGDYAAGVHRFSQALRFLGPRGPGGAAACAKVYCNRALCLSKLGLHAAAEDDATAAIELDPAAAKGWYRRAVARGEQGNKLADAVEDAKRAARLLREQDAAAAGTAAEAEALLARLQIKCGAGAADGDAQASSEPTWTTHSVPQGLWDDEDGGSAAPAAPSGGGNGGACSLEDVAALAQEAALRRDAVGVAVEPGIGRQLVATAAVPAGTDLLRDRPVAFALAKRQRLQRCARCCEELPMEGKLFWPCAGCAIAATCSRACRDAEGREGPHAEGGPECGVPWPALLPPDVVLAVRLARRLRAAQPTAADRAAAALGSHFADLAPEDAVHDATLACAAHAAFSLAVERCGGKVCPPAITAGDVLRALCMVQVNGLAIVPRAFGGAREDSIGVAVYPVASLMTHSCLPNVALRFEGAAAVVRAAVPLAPGEPLLHCYGPQAGEMTTAQRREALQAQYHFRCECPACAAPSPQKEAEMVGLRCRTAGCSGALPVPCAAPAGLASKYDYEPGEGAAGGCSTCGAALAEAEWRGRVEPRLIEALEAYSAGVEALERATSAADRQRGAALLNESLAARQELLHPHNQVLGATHAALGWVEEEGHAAQVAHCRAGAAAAAAVFPADGTNAAYEALKLGTVLQQGGTKEGLAEGTALVGAAMATLERHFGPVGDNPLETAA